MQYLTEKNSLIELEHWRTKFDVASAATEGYFSHRWVFENIFNVSEKETLRMQREKFFDKLSDAAIEPNIAIKYQRIGNADIKKIVDSSSPLVSSFDSFTTSKIVRGETENFCVDVDTNELTFDGDRYSVLNVSEKIDETKNFTLNFDMYLDPANKYGFQLLGNNTNRGFGIFQDQTVTPFIHVVSDQTLYIYNTNFELRNKVEFKTKIKQVFKRSALDDYIVTTSGNLFYKVNTQGNKIKLDCGSDILSYIGYYQMHFAYMIMF